MASPPVTAPSAAPESSPASRAQAYLAHPRFHQTFTLPATATHEALTVSYADAGRERGGGAEADDGPTVLFIPGMFATRFVAAWPAVHAVAAAMGVRVIAVDRPGLGSSTGVPLAQRVAVWVELVPALLAHVGARHVALVSHSAGTIFALNTLYQCRQVLHPERPFAALLGPFVDTAASRKRDVQLLQWIPSPVFNVWNRIPQFVQTTAQVPLAQSGAALQRLKSFLPGQDGGGGGGSSNKARARRDARRLARVYGVSRTDAAALEGPLSRALFAEDTRGANDEARLCLKKGPPGLWGACDDYAAFVRALAAQEREHRREHRLSVRAFFAADDAMSGAGGQAYVEACWREARPGGALGDVLDFAGATVEGTDHDEVASDLATLESVFLAAGGVRPTGDADADVEADADSDADADTHAAVGGTT